MSSIVMRSGLIAIYDDADHDAVSQYGWYARSTKTKRPNFYACGKNVIHRGGIFMHRLFITPPQGFHVDHINGNGLDNRRANLRICTPQQNQWNCATKGRLGVKGVTKVHNRFVSSIWGVRISSA